jgi:hypothetical protein
VGLRRASPFAGVLTEIERRTILLAYAESRRGHARRMRADQLERILRSV